MTGMRQQQRSFDIVVVLLAIALLWPLLLVISLTLLVVQGPPVLYRETRMGARGIPFTIFKFRTMLPRSNQVATVAASGDPCLTRIGKYLKPSRLDELPQLFNVLKGDMSLVGPRPLPASHMNALAPAMAHRLLAVRPGMTSAASIQFIAEDDVLAETPNAEQTYLNVILPAKVRAQIEATGDWRLARDLRILFDTLILAWTPACWQRSRLMIRSLLANQ